MKASNKHHYAVIMAGGSGTRFWPASRVKKPKQFLDILGMGRTLIQMTFDRLTEIIPDENVYVVADSRYADICIKQLPLLPKKNFIAEPGKKNTAPCVLLSSLIIHKKDPNAVILTCPADHIILRPDALNQAIRVAQAEAEKTGSLVTLGLKPDHPAIGYGYIQTLSAEINAVCPVIKFVEKPDIVNAKEYVTSGKHLWNSGMFIWTSESIIKAFDQYAEEIATCFAQLKTSQITDIAIEECYSTVPSISVDYAILERAENIKVVPVDPGWSDLGTWNSLHEHVDDSGENVCINSEPTLVESSNLLIYSETNREIVVAGLQDFTIVDMDDTLVIMPKSHDQKIKEVIELVKKKNPEII